MPELLKNKVAVVTGGSRGIGRAIAIKFAENGADIAVIATRDSEYARDTISKLKEAGSKARLYICDVSDEEAVISTSGEILADFGHVNILVNNAGITRDNLLPSLSLLDIEDVINVNLKGTILVTRAFVRSLVKQRNGNIINVSSVVGMMGNKGQSVYAASKAGIIGFTKTIAKEYGKKNIRCNAIAPGYISTEMTDKLGENQKTSLLGELPLGRFGQPEDVAELALFLASDNSSYITGDVIRVDGGMYV